MIHPEALAGGFAHKRTHTQNVNAVIADILGHGNEKAMLPGQLEAGWAKKSAAAGGLLFSQAEVEDLQRASPPRPASRPGNSTA